MTGISDDIRGKLQTAITNAYREANRHSQQQRPNLYGLSMSALGGCPRQAAYRYTHTEPSNPELATDQDARAALHGTWIHAGLLPHLERVLGGDAEHEKPVTLTIGDRQVGGTTDLWYQQEGGVVDVKTARDTVIDKIMGRDRAPVDHRIQVGGYALALAQAGHEPRWVAWLYIDRTSGDVRVMVEEWTQEFALEVLETCWRIQRDAQDPDSAERGEHGPGLSVVCDGCPWLSRCWGPAADPGKPGGQETVAADDAEVGAALAAYADARERERAAKGEKDFWREVATGGGRPSGEYGGWRFYWSKAGEVTDTGRAVELLREHSIEVPTKPGSRRLQVKPAKPSGN